MKLCELMLAAVVCRCNYSCVCLQAKLWVSEQKIQEMIQQKMRKIEEIRLSVTELEVKPTHAHTDMLVSPTFQGFLVHLQTSDNFTVWVIFAVKISDYGSCFIVSQFDRFSRTNTYYIYI